MDKIVVSLDLLRQRNFNYGQIYAALSRVTSFNCLFTVGDFSEKVIRADPHDSQEYEIIRLESYLSVEHVIGNRNSNKQSLFKCYGAWMAMFLTKPYFIIFQRFECYTALIGKKMLYNKKPNFLLLF